MQAVRPSKKALSKSTGLKTTKKINHKVSKVKKAVRTTTKRTFSASVLNNDPRFSSINADVDRLEQIRAMPFTRLAKLPNGLTVGSEQQDGGLTTICLTIDAGSRYEDMDNNGTAHFLEHLLFKGTSKRNRTQLEMEIESMGGSFNAFTSREQTVYTTTVQNRHLKPAMELLSDVFQNSTLSEKAIENERSVILEEMNAVSQDLQETVYDKMHESAYRLSALSYNILGPVENIQRISKKDIDQYIQSHYTAPRTILSVVGGDFEHDQVQDLAQTYFGNMPSAPRNGISPATTTANFCGSDIRIRDDDMPRVHLAIGFETAGWNDPDHYPLMALQMMLGSHHISRAFTDQLSSSPLVSTVARNQWADSIQPFNTIYSDTGIFGIYAVAAPNRLDVLGDAILQGLMEHGVRVPEQSLVEAKAKLTLSLLSQYEGTESNAQEIGRQLLAHGRRIHPAEVIARIHDIDQSAVQNVVQRFINDQDFVVSAVGNTFELQDYALLRKVNQPKYM